jgi:phosphosulfolactate phosphohydrolase-like enzyme
MKVYIELGSQGAMLAAERHDVIVLIDALRASTTIICALAAGASRVIPVLTVEKAFALKEQYQCPVAGERGGIKVDGFDFGNSPTELLRNRGMLAGQSLILTTSNGTRCVNVGLRHGAPAILAASPPNATAASRSAWELGHRLNRDITLLAAGLDDGPNVEDLFTAQILSEMLERDYGTLRAGSKGERAEAHESRQIFADSEAGTRLSGLGYAADVEFCSQFDILTVVPVYEENTGFIVWQS